MAEAMAVPVRSDDAQDDFLMLLPEIGRLLRWCFRSEKPDARQELVQEALCLAWQMYSSAHAKGRRIGAHGLSWFAWLGVRNGRRLCGVSNRTVQQWTSLETVDPGELLATDARFPVDEQVRFRLDWSAFVKQCSADEARAIALLAIGNNRSETAAALGMSPAWITVHMDRLYEAWQECEAEMT